MKFTNYFKTKKEESTNEDKGYTIPNYLDEQCMNKSGFEYYFWGQTERDEFLHILRYFDKNINYQKKGLEYVKKNINSIIKNILDELTKKGEKRFEVDKIIKALKIITEIYGYQSCIESKNK